MSPTSPVLALVLLEPSPGLNGSGGASPDDGAGAAVSARAPVAGALSSAAPGTGGAATEMGDGRLNNES